MQDFRVTEFILQTTYWNMKQLKSMIMAMMAVCVFTACSSSDDIMGSNNPSDLYAIIKPEGAQLIDITPSDYVLTLDNILAVNPATGEFMLKVQSALIQKPFLYQNSMSSCSIQTAVFFSMLS